MIQDGNHNSVIKLIGRLWVPKILSALFFIGLTWNFMNNSIPELPKPHPILLQSLLAGHDDGYKVLGHEYSLFKPLLPKTGRFSIILDYTFNPYGGAIEQLYTAQVYFAPLLLNPYPGEAGAIVYCSSIEKAEERMKKSGYQLLLPLSEGKALARRSP